MAGLARKIADRVGDVLGVHIQRKGRAGQWVEEDHLRVLLDCLGVDCVFDVGANAGQYGGSLRRLGYTGLILSFEPQPAAFERLSQAASGDPLWRPFNWALGSVTATLPFHVMKADVFSSFRAPTAAEDNSWSESNVVVQTIEAPIRRLDEVYDELVATYGFSRPFLKMDTQGFDLQVVEGAAARLDRFVGLSSEMAVKRLYKDTPNMSEAISAITAVGFDIVGVYPVHPHRKLNPVEFNSYAVRRDLSCEALAS